MSLLEKKTITKSWEEYTFTPCCEDLKDYMKTTKYIFFSSGDGKIRIPYNELIYSSSGKKTRVTAVCIKYCPFCGRKLE